MVAIVTGGGLGLERSSLNLLGGRGQLGTATLGRAGLGTYVNAATGNLYLDAGGEMLIGRGPDATINRTYNSRGLMNDDNGDNWTSIGSRIRFDPNWVDLGGTVSRTGSDGSTVVYTYDSVRHCYVGDQGDGVMDTIVSAFMSANNAWTWTDGRTGISETYGSVIPKGFIIGDLSVKTRFDRDGNTISYSYTGGLVTRVTMADGSYSDLTYSGKNLVSTVPAASLRIEYDAQGNVRYRQTGYRSTVGGTQIVWDDWFRYDAMDRIVTDRGWLSGARGASGTAIVRGYEKSLTSLVGGYDYAYNLVGDRVGKYHTQIGLYTGRPPGEDFTLTNEPYTLQYRIDYQYDNDGRLIEEGTTDDALGFAGGYPVGIAKPRIAHVYTRDAMGRVTSEGGGGSTTTFTLNNKGQITQQQTVFGSVTTTITNSYVDGTGLYYLGQIVGQTTVQGANTQTLANTFAWYAGPERTQTVVSGTGALSNGTTAYTLDAFGVTTGTSTTGGTTGSTSYLYDAAGQGVVRTETSGASSWRDTWYRMGGTNMWHYSNRFDPRVGGAESGQYAVQAGDTMRTIAQNLWGDADLWYKIAEANGLGANAELTENQKLIIPSGVWRTHQNAQTYIPYDAGKFLTDTTPTPLYPAPAPPGHGGQCGVFGKILLVVIAVAVTAVTYGSLGPVASATLGSVASQAVGVATGIQEKFSFKSVALAAVTAGVTKGLDKLGAFDKLGIAGKVAGSEVAGNAARGALTNAVSQGIGVATGLQDRFSWAGVAAAGIGAGVGGAIGHSLKLGDVATDPSAHNIGASFVTGMAGGIANAATRSLLTGTSFGDNVLAALPDVIGNTIGNLVAGAVSKPRLGYAGVGSNDGLAGGGGGTSGAGDGAMARPVAGVAGGGQIGGSASSDAQAGDIVVIANPEMKYMFGAMTDYQFGRYYGQYGDTSFKEGAMWALGLTAPAAPMVTASFSAVSSYDSPLIQSLKTARPYGLYSDGPAQQYMLGDGSVFTGTPSALAQFKQQRAAQANMAYMDRITGSTIGGIALGVSHEMGASPATQDLLYGLGSSADGMLLSGAALRGGSIGPYTGQNSLNIVNGENGIHANSRLSGRTTWLYELQTSDGQFLKYGISVNPNTRYSNSFMVGKRIIPITSGTRSDMLAVERQMVTANPGPLNKEPWAVKARGGN